MISAVRNFFRSSASPRQTAFFQDCAAQAMPIVVNADNCQILWNEKVEMTFGRNLPRMFTAAGDEVFLIDIKSLEEKQGNVRASLDFTKAMARKHKVDITVKVKEMVARSDADFERFGHILLKAGFEQSNGHPDLFTWHYKPRLAL